MINPETPKGSAPKEAKNFEKRMPEIKGFDQSVFITDDEVRELLKSCTKLWITAPPKGIYYHYVDWDLEGQLESGEVLGGEYLQEEKEILIYPPLTPELFRRLQEQFLLGELTKETLNNKWFKSLIEIFSGKKFSLKFAIFHELAEHWYYSVIDEEDRTRLKEEMVATDPKAFTDMIAYSFFLAQKFPHLKEMEIDPLKEEICNLVACFYVAPILCSKEEFSLIKEFLEKPPSTNCSFCHEVGRIGD